MVHAYDESRLQWTTYRFEVGETGDRTESLVFDDDADLEKPFSLSWGLWVEQPYLLSRG